MKKILLIIISLLLTSCQKQTPVLKNEEIAEDKSVNYIEEPTMEYSYEEWFDRYDVYQINRLETSSSFYHYDNETQALMASISAMDDIDQYSSSHIMSLNGTWKFKYTTLADRLFDLKGVSFKNRYAAWDTSDFDNIEVPSTIQTIKDENGNFKYENPHYTNSTYPWLNYEPIQYGYDGLPTAATVSNHVMHYSKEFKLASDNENNVTLLSFEGVLGAFYVYINGNIVGYSEDSTCNATFDISSYVHPGTNTLEVEVYQYSDASYFENQDSIRAYGIYRDVNIITLDQTYIQDIETKQIFEENTVTLQTNVTTSDTANVEIKLYDKDKLIATGDNITLDNIHLWDTDDPYLYYLAINIKDNEKTLDSTVIRIGFRNISYDCDNIYINGQKTILKGINRTENTLYGARYIKDEDIINDLLTMKQLNINAFRMAHYPNSKLTYDIADEIGLYVIDECNIESHLGEQVLNMPANNPAFNPLLLDRAMNMVERDLNHPCIIIYSLGNESTYSEYPLDENYGMYNNSLWILAKDPSRLRMYERDNRYGDTRETSMVDIASSQYYSIEQMIDANKQYDIPYVQQEFAHAMGNAVGNLKEYYDVIYQNEGICGGFIWDFVDQSILTNDYFGYGSDWGQTLNDGSFCGNGILNADRTLQAESYEVQKIYQNLSFSLTDTIDITNCYHNISDFKFIISYYTNGILQNMTTYNKTIEPNKTISLAYDKYPDNNENTIIIEAYHQNEKIAYEQFILGQYEYDTSIIPTNITYDNNMIYNDDISISIDDQLTIKYHDITISDLTFNLYRAPVDNDPSFVKDLYDLTLNIQDIKVKDDTVTISGKINKLESDFKLILKLAKNQIQITSNLAIPSVKNIQEIARIGLTMKIDNSYENMEYYGKGPFENYVDRNSAALLNIYQQKVDDSFNTKYLKPQDSGNLSEVRYLTLSNDQNQITFNMNQAMNINITRYDAMDLTNAMHIQDVSLKDYIIVNLDYKSRGLGNASLDVAPLDEYIIKQNKTYEFSTKISFK